MHQLNKLNQEIAHLRHHLYANTEPTGGMLLFKALHQCNLDGSAESFDRLDGFFEQLRQHNLGFDKMLSIANHKNLMLSIAIYIVDMIVQKIDDVPIWHKKQADTADAFVCCLVVQFTYGVCFPLQVIKEALVGEYRIKKYIEDTAQAILARSFVDYNLEANELNRRCLKKIRSGKLLDETTAYNKELKTIDFDYSLNSLKQLDKLLTAIAKKEQFTTKKYQNFVKNPANIEFLYLLGNYVGATTARLVNLGIRWVNRVEAEQLLQGQLSEAIYHNHVMIIDEKTLWLPLLAVANRLFALDDKMPKSLMGFCDEVHQKAGKGRVIALGVDAEQLAFLPNDWILAGKLAGQLAVWQMVQASLGKTIAVMSLDFNPQSEEVTFLQHKITDNTALQWLFSDLETQTKNLPYKFLSYDACVNLPTGRTDAMIVEIRVFGRSLRMQIVLPYRAANAPLGFALYPAVIINPDFDKDELSTMMQVFFEGAMSVDLAEGEPFWHKFYIDKMDLSEPSPLYKLAPKVEFDGISAFKLC